MSKILGIAWREFKHTALTKAFIIGTIIFPLIIWGGMAVVPLLVKQTVPPLEGTVALIDPTGGVAQAATKELEQERSRVAVSAAASLDELRTAAESGAFGPVARLDVQLEIHRDDAEMGRLRDAVRAGEMLGLAIVTEGVLEQSPSAAEGERLTLLLQEELNPDHADGLRRLIANAVVRARADRAGLDLKEMRVLLQAPEMDVRRMTTAGEAAGGFELRRLLPIAFMMLLWIASFASGNYLLTTTIEEKSNKVMEVLLSAVSPWQLMTGKILGQGVVGLFTIAVYGALGFGALWYFSMQDLISPLQIVYLAVFFFMAYFMVASLMAAVGSAVSDLQEAHALITPAMLILFIPMLLFVPVSQNPDGALATVTSFIPPLTPFVMIMRVTSSQAPPAWQVVAAMAVGAGGVLAMLWMAARVFRVGVLMYGKPPSPLELLRWMRYT